MRMSQKNELRTIVTALKKMSWQDRWKYYVYDTSIYVKEGELNCNFYKTIFI